MKKGKEIESIQKEMKPPKTFDTFAKAESEQKKEKKQKG